MKTRCDDCGICCHETEMILSARDIAHIKRLGHINLKLTEIVKKSDDGLYQLKNDKGYCIFFDSNKKLCTIYDVRPQGCRFYPLTFDLNVKMCILDEDCPRLELFYPSRESRTNTCKKLIGFLEDQILFTKLR